MNTAEGEIFEKLKECSSFQDENHYNDGYENLEENLSNSVYFSDKKSEHFRQVTFDHLEDEFDQLEYEFRPSAYDIDGFNETQERSFKENVTTHVHRQSISNHTQSIDNNSNKEDNYFDLNSIDFTIKTFNPSSVIKKKEQLKLSIFESNTDFDESLDF